MPNSGRLRIFVFFSSKSPGFPRIATDSPGFFHVFVPFLTPFLPQPQTPPRFLWLLWPERSKRTCELEGLKARAKKRCQKGWHQEAIPAVVFELSAWVLRTSGVFFGGGRLLAINIH